MKMKRVFATVLSSVMLFTMVPYAWAENEGDVLLHYNFDGEITEGVNYGAVIENGYACFDGVDDYIHMPNNLVSGEEDVTFVINVRPEMDGANQFTFTVGTSNSNYLFFNTHNPSGKARAAITNVGHWQEYSVTADPVNKGTWASVALVMDNKSMKLYVNGQIKSETTSEVIASGLGDTNQNFLAKSQYSGDSYFKGYIEDFAVYKKALTSEEIENISYQHANAAKKANANIVANELEFESYSLTENIDLPLEYKGYSVSWLSEDETKITNKGEITRYDIDHYVKLTATFTDEDGNSAVRDYWFNVVRNYSDEEIAQMDINSIFLVGNLQHLKENLYLPTESKHGSSITWFSEDTSVISHKGEINRAPSGGGSKSTKLWVIAQYNNKTAERCYDITVEEEDFAYLFAYFTGNRPEQEKMFYGLSRDGYHFNTINGGNPVLESTKGHKCMRDPFIMQGQNGLYYAIFTDMRSYDGWASQSSIIIFESEDLVNWDDGTIIDFNQFGWYNRAWAPQAIWDPEFYDEETGEYGAYMIYLALSSGGNTQMHKVYSRDMKTLITTPELLYRHDAVKDDIDSDIIYKDGIYYMYVKDESNGGVYVVTSLHAGGPYSERINKLPAYKNGNEVAIEGSAIFKLMNEDKYHLVYDAYMDGFFVMTETEDLVNFTQLERNEYSFNFTPRHGYVIPISKEEVDNLEKAYSKALPGERPSNRELRVYYSFDNEKDKSGNFHDAQLAHSATIAQGISGGQGLVLDGTAESYVTIPSKALEGLEDYTISAWIKPDVKDNTQRVFDFGTGTGRYMFLTPYYGKNHLRGAITAGSYDYEKGVSVDVDIETGRWTHVVMMQEGDTMRIYIDGELSGETENVTLDPYEIEYIIPYCYIGKSMWSGDKYFKGAIDEFRLYDYALTEEEVKELFENELTIACNIGENSITFVRDGEDVEAFDAVIAQYNEDGILIKAEKKTIDFTEDEEVTIGFEKIGAKVRTFWLEAFEKLQPLK